jgi:hypothetical protein
MRSATSRLGNRGSSSARPSRSRMNTRFVSDPKPDPAAVTSLATSRSTPLACSFSRAWASRSSVSAANPTSTCVVRRSPNSLRISSVGDSSRLVTGLRRFLSFCAAGCVGRKSATAAAMMTVSLQENRLMTALRISSAVVTGHNSTPAGGVRAVGPETSRTSAPRACAASASAYPIFPEDRLEMNRTGSMASCVGPAEMSRRRPDQSRRGWSVAWSTERIRASSASRPCPERPEASGPSSGSTMTAPRVRSVATCSTTVGCCHISPSMAGAKITGHCVVRSMVERRSSASPSAALARQLAVAGAIRIACACSGRERCSISWWASKRSVATWEPDNTSKVSGVTNRQAPAVMTTFTVAPSRRSRRKSPTAL